MRAWFNGRTEASQALDEGSIPFARFFNRGYIMENENQEFDVKPAGNKDLWLFLIVVDLVVLCVFGFYLYKHFSVKFFDVSAPVVAEEVQPEAETALPEEVVTAVSVAEETVAGEPKAEETVVPEETPVTAVLADIEKTQKEATATPEPQPVQTEQKESIFIDPSSKGKYRKVTFRWYGEGEKVSIVSGFTMAKPQALKKRDGYWEKTLTIAPGTYKFLFVVDGQNRRDPYSPEKDGRSLVVIK